MQNFPCVYLIFTRILGVWMHPKNEKHYGEFVVICLISRNATEDCAVGMPNGAKSIILHRRSTLRLHDAHENVETRLIASLQTTTQNRTDEVKFDSGTSAALSDRKKQ